MKNQPQNKVVKIKLCPFISPSFYHPSSKKGTHLNAKRYFGTPSCLSCAG